MNVVFQNPGLFQQNFHSVLFENDFLAVFPEIYLLNCLIFLLIYGVIYTTSKTKNYPLLLKNSTWLGLYSLLFTLFLIVNNPITCGNLFYNTLQIDQFTFFFKVLVSCGAFFSISICIRYFENEYYNGFEYLILILLSTLSLLLLVSAADFLSMYLAIELQTLCFYVLAASKPSSEFSTESGIKYFLLGAFSSGVLLFGCSLLYGFTGVTSFAEVGQLFLCGTPPFSITPSSRGCELGMILLCIGFLFKMTAVPFHMWAPDVYEGAPTPVTAFFAIVPKTAIYALFLRIFLESFPVFFDDWQRIIVVSSLASMIFGAFAALSQNRLKRLLAFSGIGHVGYLLIGLCCGTVQGVQAICLYLAVYMVMTTSIFAVLLSPIRRNFSETVERLKYISDLALISKTNPMIAITLTISLFSLAGIPPLAGFFSKAYLFFAALSSTLYLLAVVGVCTTVISCFYYIRLIKMMYFETKKWVVNISTSFRRKFLYLCIIILFSFLFYGVSNAFLFGYTPSSFIFFFIIFL